MNLCEPFRIFFGKHSAHKNHSAIITTNVPRIEIKVSLKLKGTKNTFNRTAVSSFDLKILQIIL